jgi:hypothetical protein
MESAHISESSDSRLSPLATAAVIGLCGMFFISTLLVGTDWGKVLSLQSFPGWSLTAQAAMAHVVRLSALGAISIALLGCGQHILTIFRVKPGNPWEEIAVSFGLGYGVWGTVLHALGLAGLWQEGLLKSLWILAFLISCRPVFRLALRHKLTLKVPTSTEPSMSLLMVLLFWASWFYRLRYTMVPETFFDALEYHLGLPNLYLHHQRILPTPENSFSGIPALQSMVYGWTLALDKWGILASMLHYSFMLWIGAALLGLARRLGRPSAGPYACGIFALTPVVISESYRTSVGLEWTLLELLCIVSLFAILRADAGSQERRGWTLLCGVFLGLTMTTKYPAWLLPIAIVLLACYVHYCSGANKFSSLTLSEARLLFGVAFLILLPWVLRNIWFYKNPLFPFFHERLVPNAFYMPDSKAVGAVGTDLGNFSTLSGIKNYISTYWLKPSNSSESIGPVYFILAPILLLMRLSLESRMLALLCLGTFIPLGMLSVVSRYFIPHLAILCLLLAFAIDEVRLPWLKKAFIWALFIATIMTGGVWVLLDAPLRPKLDVFSGRTTYSEYLGHHTISYPTAPYAAIEYVNANTPKDAKVLFFGEARTFHLRRPVVASSPDQRPLLISWANASENGQDLWKRLEAQGISYILVNHAEIVRTKPALKFSRKGKASLDEFWGRYTLKVFSVQEFPDRWVVVYKVLDEAAASQPHPVDSLFADYSQS